MQHIGMRLEGEGGGTIEKSDINFVDIISALDPKSIDTYPWLWSIDPYGYTLFNLYQVPHVTEELKGLSDTTPHTDLRPTIDAAIDFISKVSQHTYIRLTGD